MATKREAPEAAKAHQLTKQVPLATIAYSGDPTVPSTVVGEGWEVHQHSGTYAVGYWQGYIDLAGWSREDLTMFTQAVDIQKSFLTRNDGVIGSLPVVKEIDIITSRKLTETEILQLSTLPGFAGSPVDLMQVIYGLRRTLVQNTNIAREYVTADVETFGSGNPTAMDKLHYTRIIQFTIAGAAANLYVYPTNLVVAAVTVKEADLVWIERLRRSYVLQGAV
jgi:hypothetical protein